MPFRSIQYHTKTHMDSNTRPSHANLRPLVICTLLTLVPSPAASLPEQWLHQELVKYPPRPANGRLLRGEATPAQSPRNSAQSVRNMGSYWVGDLHIRVWLALVLRTPRKGPPCARAAQDSRGSDRDALFTNQRPVPCWGICASVMRLRSPAGPHIPLILKLTLILIHPFIP